MVYGPSPHPAPCAVGPEAVSRRRGARRSPQRPAPPAPHPRLAPRAPPPRLALGRLPPQDIEPQNPTRSLEPRSPRGPLAPPSTPRPAPCAPDTCAPRLNSPETQNLGTAQRWGRRELSPRPLWQTHRPQARCHCATAPCQRQSHAASATGSRRLALLSVFAPLSINKKHCVGAHWREPLKV